MSRIDKSPNNLRISVLLSLQRALLQEVQPSLREVTVDWNQEKIRIHCYFDGPISEIDRESMECVTTEVLADFFPDLNVELEVIRRDAPEHIDHPEIKFTKEGEPISPENSAVVYSRRED